MNEKAERINGLAAMIGIVAALGAYAVTGQIIPGFIIGSFLGRDIDDDDDMSGGMMIPASVPSP